MLFGGRVGHADSGDAFGHKPFGGSINIRGHSIIGTQKDQHVDTSSYLQAQACYPHKMKPGVHKAGDKTKSED